MLTERLTRLRSDERGFSIIEVTMVSALLMLVMAAFLSTLVTMTRTEHRTAALVSNEQDARFILNQMARELRASNPIASYATIAEYQAGFQATVGTGADEETVRWVYAGDPTSDAGASLSRAVLDTVTNTWGTPVVRLERIRNDASDPMFQYLSRSGADLIALGNATDVANCTIRVKISVTADSNPGPEPYTVKSDVHLRNQLTKDAACP